MASYRRQGRAPYWRRSRDYWMREARTGDPELREAHVSLARSANHEFLRLKRVTVIR